MQHTIFSSEILLFWVFSFFFVCTFICLFVWLFCFCFFIPHLSIVLTVNSELWRCWWWAVEFYGFLMMWSMESIFMLLLLFFLSHYWIVTCTSFLWADAYQRVYVYINCFLFLSELQIIDRLCMVHNSNILTKPK